MSSGKRPLNVWMDAVEVSQFLAAVTALQPRLALEWGAGGSTVFLLEHAPRLERLVSVEHDAAWYAKVRGLVADSRLELHHVPASEPEPTTDRLHWFTGPRNRWRRRAEEDADLLRDYVALPARLGIAFDFVLVDGRARCFCLAAGWRLLRPGGVMMLHDAQRPEYRQAIAALPAARFLSPWRRGQICLFAKPLTACGQ